MLIAIVSNSTWNIHNFRMPVIQALRSAGYRLLVMAPVDETVSALSQEAGITLVPLRFLHRDSTGVLRNLLFMAELWRLYRQHQPDLVLHFTIKPNIFGNIVAHWCRIPSVCVVTGLGYTFLHKGWLQQVTAWLYRYSFRSARNVLFENGDDRRLLIEMGIVSDDRSGVVNGCGVDLTHFQSQRPLPNIQKRMVFLFVGRLLRDKGVREFVEAAQTTRVRFPKAEFWILGGLDDNNPAHIDRGTLLEWVQSGHIRYKGSTADVRPYMEQAHWVVLPSYREGLSKVLLEAMAMARPIITTDTAGCRDAVEPGVNGFLVPVANADALALCFQTCCEIGLSEITQMGNAGRNLAVERFESSLIGQYYLHVVQAILGANHAKSAHIV
jgi:glycosyltransferase involved in cell wall biosynthesis